MNMSTSSSPAGSKSPPCGNGNENGSSTSGNSIQGKRLHVSNIPFRFRSSDLWSMFGVRS